MFCPHCGSDNVNVNISQAGASTETKGKGCLYRLFYLFMVFITCGLWLIVGPKLASSKTTYLYKKMAVCQDCGHTWEVGNN